MTSRTFDETNLNYAIKQKYCATKPEIKLQSLQEVWTFDTYATFMKMDNLLI